MVFVVRAKPSFPHDILVLSKKVVKSMQEEKHYKADRHKNSYSFGIRLDNYLMERLVMQAEKEGRSRRSIIVEALEDYLYKHEED